MVGRRRRMAEVRWETSLITEEETTTKLKWNQMKSKVTNSLHWMNTVMMKVSFCYCNPNGKMTVFGAIFESNYGMYWNISARKIRLIFFKLNNSLMLYKHIQKWCKFCPTVWYFSGQEIQFISTERCGGWKCLVQFLNKIAEIIGTFWQKRYTHWFKKIQFFIKQF